MKVGGQIGRDELEDVLGVGEVFEEVLVQMLDRTRRLGILVPKEARPTRSRAPTSQKIWADAAEWGQELAAWRQAKGGS